MFRRLREKWKVNGWQLALILSTFAMGGSLCGYFTRQIIVLLPVSNPFLYGTLYFVILTCLWPVCVLLISIPLGQFRFFRNYLTKMAGRFGLGKRRENSTAQSSTIHIAVFASGTGSNARKLMEYFQHHPSIKISLLVCNKPGAGALHHAADFGVSTLMIEKERFYHEDGYLPELQAAHIDFIVLSGFLWKVPPVLIGAYPQKIINIHPALLPKFGGAGMYGSRVHEAVLSSGDTESGITIHLVDEQYDHGTPIAQFTCPVLKNDTPESLASRIHELEYRHFAPVVEQTALKNCRQGQ